MIKRLSLFMLLFILAVACGEATPTPVSRNTQPFIEPASGEQLARGAELYAAYCAGCHGAVGEGRGPIPALDNSDHAMDHPDQFLISIIANGKSPMPAFGRQLSEQEISDIVAFFKSWWGAEQLEQQRMTDQQSR